jgi:hypothetical protein
LLEDVDWQGLFSSFFENIRMKIKCRDSSKILKERLFCIDKKLYKIAITVEVPKESGGFHGSSKGGMMMTRGVIKITLMMWMT